MKVNRFRTMLVKARKEKGLSQQDVAAMLNTSTSCISDWENGKVEPSFSTVKYLARLYNEPRVFTLFVGDEHDADDLFPVLNEIDFSSFQDLRMTALDIQNEYNDVSKEIPNIMRIFRDGVVDATERNEYEKFIKESKELIAVLLPIIMREEMQKKKALQDCRLERALV